MTRLQLPNPALGYRTCCLHHGLRISVLHAWRWRPLATVRVGLPATSRAWGGGFAPQRAVFPVPVARSLHLCRMSKSVSQLELGKPEEKGKPPRQVNGIFWILLLNLAVFVADHLFLLQQVKAFYLYHSWPVWYQFVTATFCHADWNHLSSNLFFLYIFGKLVEEEEGNLGLWISYFVTGVGANLVSWLILPRSAVSMGASGAVFGLFAISVLVKLSWDWRKILEVLILGQFVIDKVMEAAQASTRLTGAFGRELYNVNHIAHFSGALIGVALILLITRVPSQPPDINVKALKGKDKK
uniref:Rhomboid-like protease 3 n=1 Tax=Anthurium amnicola TaxID=1678845 RepID=A0A1D1XK86_9ARAE